MSHPLDKATDVNLTAREISDLQNLLNDAILKDTSREDRMATWRKLHRALGDIALEEIREARERMENGNS